MKTRGSYEWYSGIPGKNERMGQVAPDLKLEESKRVPGSTEFQPYESGYTGNFGSVRSIQERTYQEMMRYSHDQVMRHSYNQHDIEDAELGASRDELVLYVPDWKRPDRRDMLMCEAGFRRNPKRQRREYAKKARVRNCIITVALVLAALLIGYIDRCGRKVSIL